MKKGKKRKNRKRGKKQFWKSYWVPSHGPGEEEVQLESKRTLGPVRSSGCGANGLGGRVSSWRVNTQYLRDKHWRVSLGCGHADLQKKVRHVFFKLWGSNLSQFFRTQFKGVSLELWVPCICKREKSGDQHLCFLPSEASLPALDGGVDRLSTQAFLPWPDLVCPLLTQAPYSSLLVRPLRCSGDAPGVDLLASQIDF